MKKGKSFHFSFFPEKFLAGTLHLSDETRGIYILMLCRIWTLTSTQYSFPDTIPMWQNITGLDNLDKVNSIREELMQNGLEMFAKQRRKNVTFLLQNGLKKEKLKQKKKSLQNSNNAKSKKNKGVTGKRSYKRSLSENDDFADLSLFHIPYSEKQQRAPAGGAVVRDENGKQKTKKISALDESEKKEKIDSLIWDILRPILHVNQIEKIFHFMPDISLEYVQEKIAIAKSKNPDSFEAFLFSAILHNYTPPESNSKEIKKRSKSEHLLYLAQKRPLSRKEFDALDENFKAHFKKTIVNDPPQNRHYLISLPKKFECKSDELSFKFFSVGDFIDDIHFLKIKEYLKKHFEIKPFIPPPRETFHLVSK